MALTQFSLITLFTKLFVQDLREEKFEQHTRGPYDVYGPENQQVDFIIILAFNFHKKVSPPFLTLNPILEACSMVSDFWDLGTG